MEKEHFGNTLDLDLYEEAHGEQDKVAMRANLQHKEVERAFKTVLETKEGQTVFTEIMRMCLMDATVMTGDSKTFYHLGTQAVGLALKRKIMEIDPSLYASIDLELWQPLRLRSI